MSDYSSELDPQLLRCFESVFPKLSPTEIRTASVQSLDAWDSLASVTLVAVIQQELGVQIDLLDLPELDSFEAFRAYVRRLSPAEK